MGRAIAPQPFEQVSTQYENRLDQRNLPISSVFLVKRWRHDLGMKHLLDSVVEPLSMNRAMKGSRRTRPRPSLSRLPFDWAEMDDFSIEVTDLGRAG